MLGPTIRYLGRVHVYQCPLLSPPTLDVSFQTPELSCSTTFICFLAVVNQHKFNTRIITLFDPIFNTPHTLFSI